MSRWTNLETWPNRDVFIFGIHASAFVIRRAIDVLQSMNPKKRWRILQITWLRHFVYSKNSQAYSNLNFGDIVRGEGGGGWGGRSIWRIVRTSWKILATPWFNQPFGEELSSYSSTVFFVLTAVIFIWVSRLWKQPFLLAAGDVWRGGKSSTLRQKFHTDDVKSVRNPVISADWTTK